MFKIKVGWNSGLFEGSVPLHPSILFEIRNYTPTMKKSVIDGLDRDCAINTYDDFTFSLILEKWLRHKDSIELEVWKDGNRIEIDELGYLKDDNLYCSMRDVVRRINDIRLEMLERG